MKAIYCAKCSGLIEAEEGYIFTGHFCTCIKNNYPIGWICPRCNRIISPYMSHCSCTDVQHYGNIIHDYWDRTTFKV